MKFINSIILSLVFLASLSFAQSNEEKSIRDDFVVKMINDLVISPNGKYAAFNAVGKIKLLELKKDKLTDLTKSTEDFEFEPAFSHDNKKIIFSSWNESGYSKINIWNINTNEKKTILITSGIYKSASFSPDGNMIVYKKEIEVGKVNTENQRTEGIYVLNLSEGDPIKISEYGDNPQFSQDGKSIIYQSGTYRLGSFVKTFEAVDLKGENKQILFYGKYGHEYAISLNQKMVAWQELGKIYLASFPKEPMGISADNKNLDKRIISDLPGNNLDWSTEDRQLSWSISNSLYIVNPSKVNSLKVKEISLKCSVGKPKGELAFTNARIISMEGDEILEDGTLIVKENRIVDIGADLKIPKKAFTINCSGMTIMPGLIELSPASNNFDYNLSPIKQWEYIELLKMGITTKLDGSFRINEALTNRELVFAEKLIGPRLLNGGVTIAKMDLSIFSDERSYQHYIKSNCLIAKAFEVTAIQSDVDLQEDQFIILQNAQGDTSLVHPDDLHNSMIQQIERGGDPHNILKKYTYDSAELIGMKDQLGSITKGKLADLVIVNGNPLENMNQIKNVSYTVVNGRVYDNSTMEEIGNYNKMISQTVKPATYESLSRTTGSACCGFQH